jgi:hypothetical protein
MQPSARWRWKRLCPAALGVLFCASVVGLCEPCGGLTLDQLQRMNACQLAELFTRSCVGRPLVGRANGRLLYLTDPKLPRVKVRLANSVWRGKAATEDGYFTNRWIGGVKAIASHYVIGPSWVDGQPAVIMEYAPGTALFANMHDELREVAPGLYMGPVYERFPCPKFRGYVALELEPCKGGRGCR